MTELALIKLTRPETSSDAEAVLSRVERIERRLGKPDPVPAPGATAPETATAPPPPVVETPAVVPPTPAKSGNGEVEKTPEPAAPVPAETGPAVDVSLEQLQKVWPGLFGSLRDVLGARRWAFFREAVPAVAVEGNVIVLEVPMGFISNRCKRTTRSLPSSPHGPVTCSAGLSGSDSGSEKALPTVPASRRST